MEDYSWTSVGVKGDRVAVVMHNSVYGSGTVTLELSSTAAKRLAYQIEYAAKMVEEDEDE